jgi:CubicO group peptidase (beta-lactamase class C family)
VLHHCCCSRTAAATAVVGWVLALAPGAWRLEAPEAHGLSRPNLRLASERLRNNTPVRDCFVVVRDGVVVYDSYRAPLDNFSLIVVDSIGKTMTALIVGHAVSKGLLDIDKPLLSYGVQPMKGVQWNGFYPNVTTRHLLSQTSGQGKFPPGTAFTYDSDQYIGHLTPLLRQVTGMSPLAFATEFAALMGLPELYKYEATIPNPAALGEFTIGGGA